MTKMGGLICNNLASYATLDVCLAQLHIYTMLTLILKATHTHRKMAPLSRRDRWFIQRPAEAPADARVMEPAAPIVDMEGRKWAV